MTNNIVIFFCSVLTGVFSALLLGRRSADHVQLGISSSCILALYEAEHKSPLEGSIKGQKEKVTKFQD
jgi:hypothetical protein